MNYTCSAAFSDLFKVTNSVIYSTDVFTLVCSTGQRRDIQAFTLQITTQRPGMGTKTLRMKLGLCWFRHLVRSYGKLFSLVFYPSTNYHRPLSSNLTHLLHTVHAYTVERQKLRNVYSSYWAIESRGAKRFGAIMRETISPTSMTWRNLTMCGCSLKRIKA